MTEGRCSDGKCRAEVKFDESRKRFECKRCRSLKAYIKILFFYKSSLKVNEIVLLRYLWLFKSSWTTVKLLACKPNSTITDYFKKFRTQLELGITEDYNKIGREGIIIKLYESKFRRHKYNKGYRNERVFLLSRIERTKERKIFLVQKLKIVKLELY